MATVEQYQAITLPAAADLSAKQYTFVTVNTSGQAAGGTAQGDNIIGVLMNKPGEVTAAAGEPAEVAYAGVAKVKLGATVAAGAKVECDANGAAITAGGAGAVVVGTVLKGGDAGHIVPILLVSKDILAA